MKKILFIIFLSYYAFLSFSQPDSIFVSDKRLFWNKNLPVYLWISTDSLASGNDFLLYSQKTPQYTNPMFFDTEGFNTFQVEQVFSTDSRPEHIVFKIFADGYPPQIEVKLDGTEIAKNVFRKNVAVKIKAVDYISKVKSIYYSVNDSNFEVYKDVLNIDKKGNYVLKVYAVDNVDNKSDMKILKFTIK